MSKQIKRPLSRGVAKVPFVMQLEASECGAACLCMILAHYGKWIPLEQVRGDCGVSRDGASALNIVKAARHYGLEASGYRCEPEQLMENGTFPCIIHWNFDHFVVLNGFKGGKAYISNPAHGTYHVPMEVFDEHFTGICIQCKPTETFVPSGKPESTFSFAARLLKGTGAAIAFTVLTGAIAALLAFMQPAFSRIFLDRLLTGTDKNWTVPFLLLLGVFSLVEILMSALQAIYAMRINGKMAAIGNTSYMWKVLRMPIRFFSQRPAGEIQQRQLSNAVIANTLISIVAPLLLDAGLTVFYLAVMIRYSILLSLIGILSVAVNIIVARILFKKRLNVVRVAMYDEDKLSAVTVSGIQMMETIKSSGAENGFFKKWSGYQANYNSQKVKCLQLEQYIGILPQVIMTLANFAVLFIGVFLTIQGEFTAGMVMAFQGFLMSFMPPVQTFISSGQVLQEMHTMMERVDDVMNYPDDTVFDENPPAEGVAKLTGNITLKNVVFGYSPLAAPLIRDFNLTLQPGKSVAIVGASGCGKSTVSKLISGLYKPWEGEILFDGKPMSEIPKTVFRSSVAVVDQECVLFEDTVAANIKMWDESIEDFEMILAARDAHIHDVIMERPKGYQSKIVEGGKDFSGGQRQRMEIARALAQDPTVIILDEATSALDAKTEYEVIRAINERHITCIVIAHRLSTVRSCDEIIVIDRGEIKDRGTHEELMQKSGIYRNLITAE